MPKVSVIVPVYNSEKYLEKCLDSLIHQTLYDVEIIIVNDGSTDKSEEIINKYLKDGRVIYLKKENGGQASARNLGLSVARGEYISFIDSDDYVNLDMLDSLYKASLSKYDIVVCDFYLTYTDKDIYSKILKRPGGEINGSEYLFSGAGPSNKIYKTEFLKKNNFKFPEGIIYEDYAAIPSLVIYSPSIYYLNRAFLHYMQNENSTMRVLEYKPKLEDIFIANDILYNNLKNTKYNDELTYMMAYHFLLEASLRFYKFKKYDQIDKISKFMKENFPDWASNKYVKELSFKYRILMKLFYLRKYNVISLIQKLKG